MTIAAGMLVATIVDLRTRRIPNQLTAAMAVDRLGTRGHRTSAASPSWAALAGLVLGLAVMMPGHLLGATGAGDVKLMAAAGALLGPALVVTAFIFTALAGGVLASPSRCAERLAATSPERQSSRPPRPRQRSDGDASRRFATARPSRSAACWPRSLDSAPTPMSKSPRCDAPR